MSTPPDQKAELVHAILFRRGLCPELAKNNQPTSSLADRAAAIFDTVAK